MTILKRVRYSMKWIMVDCSACFEVLLAGFSYENVAGVISVSSYATPFYNGTEAEFNATFAQFLAIPTATTSLGPLSYHDITKVLPADSDKSEGVRSVPVTSFFLTDSVFPASCAYRLTGLAVV